MQIPDTSRPRTVQETPFRSHEPGQAAPSAMRCNSSFKSTNVIQSMSSVNSPTQMRRMLQLGGSQQMCTHHVIVHGPKACSQTAPLRGSTGSSDFRRRRSDGSRPPCSPAASWFTFGGQSSSSACSASRMRAVMSIHTCAAPLHRSTGRLQMTFKVSTIDSEPECASAPAHTTGKCARDGRIAG